jgi:hypothetical protein
MSIPESLVNQLNADLRGQAVWGLSRGMGSYLNVEIGPTRQRADGSQVGAWHLWVYMADWRIERGVWGRGHVPEIVIGSNDLPELIDDWLTDVGATTFESVTVSASTGDTAFTFGGGLRLVVFASALPTDDSEAWVLTRPDGSTLSGGPGNRWALESAS